MSRPEKPINWILVDNLLEAGCLGTEIAAHFDMHPNTFYDRVSQKYNMSFTEYSTQKKQKGESLLRATQFAKAIGQSSKGDNTLLIWLGKQRLGQKETQETNTPPNQAELTFSDAFLKSEGARLLLEKKVMELEGKLNAIQPQTDFFL